MHRRDESLDWTEKNIDMQILRSFWPKLEKIRQVREALQKSRIFWEFQNLRGEWGGVNISKKFLFRCANQLTWPKKLVNSGQNFQRGGIGSPLWKNSLPF